MKENIKKKEFNSTKFKLEWLYWINNSMLLKLSIQIMMKLKKLWISTKNYINGMKVSKLPREKITLMSKN